MEPVPGVSDKVFKMIPLPYTFFHDIGLLNEDTTLSSVDELLTGSAKVTVEGN